MIHINPFECRFKLFQHSVACHKGTTYTLVFVSNAFFQPILSVAKFFDKLSLKCCLIIAHCIYT